MRHLTEQERAVLRAEISERRERSAARAAALSRDFDEIVTASADAVRDDEHDPEGATIAFERAQVAALLADAQEQVSTLERVSAQLDDTAAGNCEHCGAPIPFERLLARPTATRCVPCADASAQRRG